MHLPKRAGAGGNSLRCWHACFDRRLFPKVPSEMSAEWDAEKEGLPAAVPDFKQDRWNTYTGADAAQALLGKACHDGDLDAVGGDGCHVAEDLDAMVVRVEHVERFVLAP